MDICSGVYWKAVIPDSSFGEPIPKTVLLGTYSNARYAASPDRNAGADSRADVISTCPLNVDQTGLLGPLHKCCQSHELKTHSPSGPGR